MRFDTGRRFLAGVRFTDAVTGAPTRAVMRVAGAGLELVANRRGVLGVRAARGFSALVDHTDPSVATPVFPAVPATSVDFEIVAWDADERYVPRRFTLTLPRPWSDGEGSLFEPVDVPMYPDPTARLSGNWAVVRGRVVDLAGEPIPGALVRVRRAPVEEGDPPGEVLARGLTAPLVHPAWPDRARRSAGEFVVPVAGLPVTTWGSGEEVIETTVAAVVEVVVDPAAPRDRPPHPDEIENPSAEGDPPERIVAMVPAPIALAPGRHEVVSTISVDLNSGG